MKIGYLITARMKSTRLPNKLLLEVQGRQFIRWMIDRLKLSPVLDEIIICTSINHQDNILEDIAKKENIKCFRGHEEDVIKRLYDAAISYNLDYALNITADCPLVSFEYIQKIVECYNETNADLVRSLELPHGFFSYGLKVEAMRKVCEIKNSFETEVWGKYFTESSVFNVVDIAIPKALKRPDYRLTLDYPEDFTFFEKVYNHFGVKAYQTSMKDIIAFLDDNPQIVAINKNMKNAYTKRWKAQSKISLK